MTETALPSMDPQLREIFRVAYIFRQKYQHPTDDLEFWQRVVDDLGQLSRHCNNHPLARKILTACYMDIERECVKDCKGQANNSS